MMRSFVETTEQVLSVLMHGTNELASTCISYKAKVKPWGQNPRKINFYS
jgi:hypothetical protein